MRPEALDMLRSNRAAQAGAAIFALLALVGIAKIVTSHSSKPVVTARSAAGAAPVSAPAVKPAADLALAPNETLVVPPEKPAAPLMPHYSAPQPPPAAPTVPDQPQAPAAVVAEAQAALAEQKAASIAPQAPLPAPAPPPPLAAPRFPADELAANHVPNPSICAYCGQVQVVTVWPDMAELSVRFEDGAVRSVRTGVPTPWRVGDRVRVERGRLVRD